MKLIKDFVAVNRRCSDSFRNKFPSLYWNELSREFFQHEVQQHLSLLESSGQPFRILEIGGVDRPFLTKSDKYTYVGLDIDERDRCYEVYDEFIVQSVENPIEGEYDLIISRMLIEHVPNNEKSFENIYTALKPGGLTCHVFPGGRHPFSLCTRLLGNTIQRKLIPILRPGTEGVTGYPAFYNLCSYRACKKKLETTGYSDIKVVTNYQAEDYFAFFFPAYLGITAFNNIFQKSGIKAFASNLCFSAKKPSSQAK